jgi:hypothetical protein
MRRWFLVLAKFLGLLLITWIVGRTGEFCYVFFRTIRPGEYLIEPLLPQRVCLIVFFILSGGMAWVLLRRTGWLADKLDIPNDELPGEINKEVMLYCGTILLGIYVTVQSAPRLVGALLRIPRHEEFLFRLDSWSQVISEAMALTLGLLLLLRTPLVLKWIAQVQTACTPKNSSTV